MVIDAILAAIGIDTIRGGLRSAKSGLTKREYKLLIASAVAELLKECPDLDLAEAHLLAAEAMSGRPTVEMLRARSALERVKAFNMLRKGVNRMAATKGTRRVYRDSGTGQFVKKDYAKKHPKTTESDTVPAPKRKK